jgi:hypothetical protein
MASRQTLLLKGPRSRPLTGDENQPLKPKSRRSRAQVALTVSSAEATASTRGSLTYGNHHLSTDDSGHLPTNTAPANGGRPKAHRQVLTPVLTTGTRTGPSQNTSTALAAYNMFCDPPMRPTAQGGAGHAAAASATDGERPSPPITEERSGPPPTRRRAPTRRTLLPNTDGEHP